jgi:membrane-associated phospholipid phosphatase
MRIVHALTAFRRGSQRSTHSSKAATRNMRVRRRRRWLDEMIGVVTDLGDSALLLLGSFALFALLLWEGSASVALAWAVAVAVCLALTFVAKLVFITLHIYGAGENWLNVVSPSGHTSLSLVFYGGLAAITATGRSATLRWMSYGLTVLLVVAIGVTRILRDDHSAEEIALGFAIGGISVWCFALLRRKAQHTAIPWQQIAGLVVFLIGAAYLLSGKHLTAEGTINEIAQQVAATLRDHTTAQ